jgi:hypothetical protein
MLELTSRYLTLIYILFKIYFLNSRGYIKTGLQYLGAVLNFINFAF